LFWACSIILKKKVGLNKLFLDWTAAHN